jgi:hypothetical protein
MRFTTVNFTISNSKFIENNFVTDAGIIGHGGRRIGSNFTLQEAQMIGFRVTMFPATALGPVCHSVAKTARSLNKKRNIPQTEQESAAQFSRKPLFKFVRLKEALKFDIAAGEMYPNRVYTIQRHKLSLALNDELVNFDEARVNRLST